MSLNSWITRFLMIVFIFEGAEVSGFMARLVLRSDHLLGFFLSCELDLGHRRHVIRRVAEEGWRRGTGRGGGAQGKNFFLERKRRRELMNLCIIYLGPLICVQPIWEIQTSLHIKYRALTVYRLRCSFSRFLSLYLQIEYINILMIIICYRKLNRKQQHEQTNKKRGRHTHENKLQPLRPRRTRKHTPLSRPATSRAKATSCSSTRSEATRTTIRGSACPSVATPSRTRWAHSPRTSPPPPNRTTTPHADRGRSAWWVCAALHASSRWQWFCFHHSITAQYSFGNLIIIFYVLLLWRCHLCTF